MGYGDGENCFIVFEKVMEKLLLILYLFDLIVGIEEEFYIVGGIIDMIEVLCNVCKVLVVIFVCKCGLMGVVVFENIILDSLDDGIFGFGFLIDVFNVFGVGDGFMLGFLKGWIIGEDWVISLIYVNVCGVFVVLWYGCMLVYLSW